MAGDFTMAGLAMMSVQRGDNLGRVDSYSSRANCHQTRPVAGGVARVALCDTTQKALQRVLASPHRLKLLALKGFYIDKNQVIRKDPNFNSVAIAPKHKALSLDAAVHSSRPVDPPSTPSSTAATGVASAHDTLSPTDTGVAFARESPINFAQHHNTTDCVNMAPSTLDNAVPDIASIDLDKELPPKPILCIADSPERRGVFDAYDSSSEKVKYPVLQPTFPNTPSPSPSGSDDTDFQLSPSLRGMDYSPELMVARAVKIHKLDQMVDHQYTRVKKTDIAEVAAATAPPKTAQQLKQARRLPTTGQIAAIRAGSTGSPVYRGLPKSKFNGGRGSLYTRSFDSLTSIQEGKAGLKQEVKTVNDVFRPDSGTGSNIDSPQGFDDITRRYTKFGIGPTVKCATDAHEVIMGDRYPRMGSASSGKSAGVSNKGSTISGSSTFKSSKVEAHISPGVYPPRISSLPASDEDLASRLARPTKASAARAQANSKAAMGKSATMTSVKKLGERISSIIPGRGRSGTFVSNGKSKSMGAVNEKHEVVAGIRSAEVADNNLKYQTAYYGRARIITIGKNSKAVKSSSSSIGDINDETVIGEPSDKLAPEESYRDKKERRAAAAYASGNHIQGNTGRNHGAVNQPFGRDQDDDGPPTPRATGAGPQGHYTEGELSDEERREELLNLLEMMRTNVDGATGLDGVESSIDLLQANGRHLISLLASAAERVENPVLRGHVAELIRIVGGGLHASNANMAAIIALVDSNQRALTITVAIAEYVDSMIYRAAAMYAAQQ